MWKAGTYVASVLPEALLTLAPPASPVATQPPGQRAVSQRSARLLADAPQPLWHDRRPAAAFRVLPALDQFPRQIWQRLLVRSWQAGGEYLLSYGEDYAPLRQAIAGYLGPARGVRCTPDQVILVAGAQQGLDLAARVLLEPGQTAWIEDPGYPGARGALLAAGVQPVPVPVDAEGLDYCVPQIPRQFGEGESVVCICDTVLRMGHRLPPSCTRRRDRQPALACRHPPLCLRRQKPLDSTSKAWLNLLRKFSNATIAVSSTISAAVGNSCWRRANSTASTSWSLRVMRSAYVRASRSRAEKCSLVA